MSAQRVASRIILLLVVAAVWLPSPASGAAAVCVTDDWTLNRYPPGYKFAFTIVHDADSAYSERLRPLFEVFDQLGFKLTVTVFTAWADWAHDGAIWARWRSSTDPELTFFAPKAVPLSESAEREFYKQLAAHGHEIGLHSPSDTSDRREQVRAAFEYFNDVFGYPPKVYVEHSARTNKEALAYLGADPTSPYYCADLLKQDPMWVWIDDAGGLPGPKDERYYEIRPNASLFNISALQRYGTTRAFMRTGKAGHADGDGFLEWYSQEHIDALERDGGIALVYMHLDAHWLDPQTRKMRAPLQDRLRYLSSKAGWFVPAGEILDRVHAVEGMRLSCDGPTLRVENANAQRVDRLVIMSRTGKSLVRDGRVLPPNASNQIVIESVRPSETLSFGVQQE